jgi:hypothetical protein
LVLVRPYPRGTRRGLPNAQWAAVTAMQQRVEHALSVVTLPDICWIDPASGNITVIADPPDVWLAQRVHDNVTVMVRAPRGDR